MLSFLIMVKNVLNLRMPYSFNALGKFRATLDMASVTAKGKGGISEDAARRMFLLLYLFIGFL